MNEVFICDGIRTPIGRYAGSLSSIRADDLAALSLTELMKRNSQVDWLSVDDVILGCANQSGEDNRNVARMATLLSGLPVEISASTINRLCGSGLNSIGICASLIKAGDADFMIAGGVENMSRAPLVMNKAEGAFGRDQKMYDTTMGWRFINSKLNEKFGTEDMPKTAQNLADTFFISRKDQDEFACWSQNKAAVAQKQGLFGIETFSIEVPAGRKKTKLFFADEHLRPTKLEELGKLNPIYPEGSVTAGNSSGINDGAAAILIASKKACKKNQLSPVVKVLGMATSGVEPTHMGIGPVSATLIVLDKVGLKLSDMDILEFNEAFSAQVLTCIRQLGLADNDERINRMGGAIALGHPLGMSGTRLVITAMRQLERSNGRYALCTMCVGVGQGISIVLEKA